MPYPQLHLRCVHSREAQAGQVGRGVVFRPCTGRIHARRRSLPADTTNKRTLLMAGYRWRSRHCSPTTQRAHSPRRRTLQTRGRDRILLIKIPGTKGVCRRWRSDFCRAYPINVTLLFSREHYVAAADAFLRGIERRLDAGLNPNVGSVASVFVSRWDGPSPTKYRLR